MVTIPLTITDTSKWYYLDAYFSTAAGTPTVLYQTTPPSGSAAGSNYGTYVQVAPFGNYLTSATGVASGLLMNCYGTTTLSAPVTSNTFRLAMTTANGWTVNGISTSLTVTAGGNFQINQVGIYEVSLCLNTVGATPMMFGVGSLATDTAPGTQGPYLYQYAPMYTQDPTTTIKLPLNITDTAKYYYIDVIFPGTQATVALSNVSTYVSLRPVGSYVSPSTNPWSQQGTTVTYNSGLVGIGAGPAGLSETLTVSGNTSFVGNVTVTSDAAGSSYVTARRVPAGSLSVQNYVTGSVPLTTTTNLIQNYLSNAATIRANTSTGTITQALYCPGTPNSYLNFPNGSVSPALANLALSNIFIEAWVNLSQTGVQQGLICRQTFNGGPGFQDFRMWVDSTNFLRFAISTTSGTPQEASNAVALAAGAWYHVVGSYQATSTSAGTTRVFVNGGLGNVNGTVANPPRLTASANIYIGTDTIATGPYPLAANVADVRIWYGGFVPTATFASPAAAPFGATQPAYITGSPSLLMSLNSQYFPGASTSPYGPVLTLPGTVGSYYTQTNSSINQSVTAGFTIEAWVNFASLANSNAYFSPYYSYPYMMSKGISSAGGGDWTFGPTTGGQLLFNYGMTGPGGGAYALITSGTITTGSWNHLVVQANTAGYFNMFINGQIQVLTAQNYSPTGSGTATALLIGSGTPTTNYTAVTVGQYGGAQGPNFAIAKARILFGANTYTTSTFTPSPNLGAIPVGGTVAWQLESQFPMITYPSFFDVPVLPQQTPIYGAEPVVVGGVTSNVLGPFSTTYPQLDSLRFDGTGYIDYGNAASSALTSNIWASPWTIEAWVYPTSFAQTQIIASKSNSAAIDYLMLLTAANPPNFYLQTQAGYIGGGAVPLNTWTHVAVTHDGTRANAYVSGTLSQSSTIFTPTYTPTNSFQIGTGYGGSTTFAVIGNLADVRVSNAAIYTGSSFTVPSAPLPVLSSTMLLLRSLAGQTGTTLEVQGRGLNSVSLGGTRTVQSYPPAPMSSYLIDTTSNASVTYGQGKYVASASTEFSSSYVAWQAFDKRSQTAGGSTAGYIWASASAYTSTNYTGSVTTVDVYGNSYSGEWLQVQVPVSVALTSFSITASSDAGPSQSPSTFYILGSRDGLNWNLVNSQSGFSTWSNSETKSFTVSATQAYNYYRIASPKLSGAGTTFTIMEWILNGTEEGLVLTSDSKVGVGIANPQRALEVAGDVVVGGTVSSGNPLMYRNRIINGDFRIAQKGAGPFTYTNGVGTFDLDRWRGVYITSGTFTTAQSSTVPLGQGFTNSLVQTMTVATAANDYGTSDQGIEGYNLMDLNWGTSYGSPATLSFWTMITNVPAGSVIPVALQYFGSSATYYFNSAYTVSAPGAWQYVTLTVPPPPSAAGPFTSALTAVHTNLKFVFTSSGASNPVAIGTWNNNYNSKFKVYGTYDLGSTVGWSRYITGVQLEKGTVATPFEFRPYATELALCQTWNNSSAGTGSTSICLNTAGGNVGIGITNPATTLHVAGDILSGTSAGGYYYGSLAIQYDGNTNYGSIIGKSVKWDGTNYIVQSDGATPRCCAMQMSFDAGFKFVTTSASGSSPLTLTPAQFGSNVKMVINLQGAVGIGTATPGYFLQVNSATTGSETLAAFLKPSIATGGTFAGIQVGGAIATGGAGAMGFLNYGTNSTNVFQLSVNGVGGSAIGINASGVGIGTTNPGSLLEISATGAIHASTGTLRFYRSDAATWWKFVGPDTGNTLYLQPTNTSYGVYITATSTAWTGASDARLKNIIEPISNAIAKVNILNPVMYSWKTDVENTPHPGLIAQDVLEVQPEAVSTAGDGMYGVRYTELIPLALAAIKELSAQNKALEQSLATATANISSLEARLAAIEARLAS